MKEEEITEENEEYVEDDVAQEDNGAGAVEKIQEFLDEIRSGLNENNGRLDNDVLTKLLSLLTSMSFTIIANSKSPSSLLF